MECKICGRFCKNKLSLGNHIKAHKIKSEEYTIQYIHGGIIPKCKCGCGKDVEYSQVKSFTFNEYVIGHHSYEEGYWGDLKDRSKHDKKGKTRKKRFENGELEVWNKGLDITDERVAKLAEGVRKENNPERAKKISDKLIGKPKSAEHAEFSRNHLKKYWSEDESREKQSRKKIEYLINNHKQYTSKLEDLFIEQYLKPNSVKFERFFYAKEIKCFYDFYIKDHNTIIETDGDFWHCNPDKFPEAKFAPQRRNKEKDVLKNEWANKNGFKMLRLWENDIKNNKDKVIKLLKENNIIT